MLAKKAEPLLPEIRDAGLRVLLAATDVASVRAEAQPKPTVAALTHVCRLVVTPGTSPSGR